MTAIPGVRAPRVAVALFVALALAVPPAPAEVPVPCASCNGGVWVSSGRASFVPVSPTSVRIDQRTSQAILNWQSFNVSAGSSVEFRQPSRDAVALNRIFQADPSRIFGSVTANGQIYLINANGFLFGAGAAVNTQGLIASTLDISDEVFEEIGLVRAVNQGLPAFEGQGTDEAIVVQQGARLASGKDGRVVLIAPRVSNRGDIETPEGQAILVGATDKVYLEASDDPDLRGLLVEVATGGDVSNLGTILAERGNATLIGAAVNQDGLVRATTSVSRNGSVRLLARDNAVTVPVPGTTLQTVQATRTGELTLGAGSRTEILPETGSDDTAPDAQAQVAGRVEGLAASITLERDAQITVPGGRVDLTATVNPQSPLNDGLPENDTRIVLETGAAIDVSGSESAVVPYERNMIEVELRGNELRDNPVNRDGPVRGETVIVDARRGTRFADVTAFTDSIGRTVAERTSLGGSIELRAEGRVDVAAGATLDVSGGLVAYQGGENRTSYLFRNGALTSISDADPDLLYEGVLAPLEVRSDKWGVLQTFGLGPLNGFEDGYTEGKDAGRVAIQARRATLEGAIVATTQRGRYQRLAPGAIPDTTPFRAFDQLALGGLLVLGNANLGSADRGFGQVDIRAQGSADASAVVDPALFAGTGVNRVQVFADRIRLSNATSLDLGAAGELALFGADLEVLGDVRTPGGRISLLASETLAVQQAELRIGDTSVLDVSGVWVNDVLDLLAGREPAPLTVDGGSIALESTGSSLEIPAGSRLLADGGARFVDGSLIAGVGGDVSISLDPTTPGPGDELRLAGEVSGLSAGRAGTFSLQAPGLTLGPAAPAGRSQVRFDFLEQAGFSNYRLEASQTGVEIQPGTLALVQASFVPGGSLTGQATGSALRDFSEVMPLPAFRRNPVGLEITSVAPAAAAAGRVPLEILAGTRIETDAGGRIALRTDASIFIDGVLTAPGGQISLAVETPSGFDPGLVRNQMLWLGDNARLDVSGTFIAQPNPEGLRLGEIFDAGRVELKAERGYLIARPGATVRADGIAAGLDLAVPGPVPELRRVTVTGTAGTVDLEAAEGIYFGGLLSAAAAGIPGAIGGELRVAINPVGFSSIVLPGVEPFLPIPREVRVGNLDIPVLPRGEPVPDELNGVAAVDLGLLTGGGFDTVSLEAGLLRTDTGFLTGRVVFVDDADLAVGARLNIDAPEIEVRDSDVRLSAPQVTLGTAGNGFDFFLPALSLGTSSLLIDAGTVQLAGYPTVNGLRPAGDGLAPLTIRAAGDLQLRGLVTRDVPEFAGALRTLSDVRLQAAQVYPSSLSRFEIAVERDGGRIVIGPGTAAPGGPPLSVAGELRLAADSVAQRGRLAAPFGRIEIDAPTIDLTDGSVTTVSGDEASYLFGQTQFQRDWILPLGGQLGSPVLTGTPAKTIALNGDSVRVADGALLDISGGGDLQAYEFLPGPGGSSDFLATAFADEGAFAIVPGRAGVALPFEPYQPVPSGMRLGDAVTIAANGIIPEGQYNILPPHYALLPGAFLLTPTSETQVVAPGVARFADNGLPVVDGKRSVAGTGFAETLWTGFAVADGEAVRSRAEYFESRASEFFVDAGAVPGDNGNLTLAATGTLVLQGSLGASESGRPAALDLVAERIRVVAERSGGSDAVELVADELAALGAGSLLLGGSRIRDQESVQLQIAATSVEVSPDVSLALPEVIVAATDTVTIGEGAAVTAGGTLDAPPLALTVAGDGGLLVASQRDVAVERDAVAGAAGTVIVADNARVTGGGTVIIDSSLNTELRGAVASDGGRVSLVASGISLGDAPAGTTGLVLPEAVLAGLAGSSLALTSRGALEIFGPVQAQFRSLSVDATGVAANLADGDVARLRAGRIVLQNSVGPALPVAEGTGELLLQGDELSLAGGEFGISGLAHTTLRVTGPASLNWTGESALSVAGDLDIATPVLHPTPDSGQLAIAATGALRVLGTPAETGVPAGLGGRLSLSGASVQLGTRAVVPSGLVSVTASAGDLVLDGAILDVAGVTRDFDGTALATPGGRVELVSLGGDLRATAARIDVAGGAAGTAGDVVLDAAGDIELAGTQLTADGGGGALKVSAGNVSSGLVALLRDANAAGFDRELAGRVRDADLALGASAALRARSIALAADGGELRIAGLLDASGERGGRISLAGARVRIDGRAVLDAGATGQGADGGRISIGAGVADEFGQTTGTLTFAAAAAGERARVAVDGGPGGEDGAIALRAPAVSIDGILPPSEVAVIALDAAGQPALLADAADITGAARVDVEAYQYFTDADLASPDALIRPALDTFAGVTVPGGPAVNLDAIEQRLGLDGAGGRVLPGAEIRAAGDALLSSPFELTAWRFDGRPGALTVRAGGNLSVSADVSDGVGLAEPFPGLTRLSAGTDDSWSLRFASGADLASADVLAVNQGTGNLVVSPGVQVRTGTGSIGLAGGGDFSLGAGANVYTLGRNRGPGSYDVAELEILLAGDFLTDGGDVTLDFGGDVASAPRGQLVNDWLARAGGSNSNSVGIPSEFVRPVLPTAWAVNLSRFNQGVATLGGGDVRVTAGGDIVDFSLSVATTGLPVGDVGDIPDVAGGGDLVVRAGGDVRGGVFYAADGAASLRAGGDVGAAAHNPVLALGDAAVQVTAGGGIVLDGVIDPFLVDRSAQQGGSVGGVPILSEPPRTYFLGYAADARVDLASLAGDVALLNDGNALATISPDVAAGAGALIYPPTLTVSSFGGGISTASMALAPASRGQLALFAERDIDIATIPGSVAALAEVTLSDADPATLASVANPTQFIQDITSAITVFDGPLSQPSVPVHLGDPDPVRLVSNTGIIGGQGAQPLTFRLAKKADVYGGAGISNLNLLIQHVSARDISRVESGGDIVFPFLRGETGAIIPNSALQLSVAGPGRMAVLARGDIDLGTSGGITSIGDSRNPALPDTGADLSVLAGLTEDPDYAGFATEYFVPPDGAAAGDGDDEPVDYSERLVEYLAGRGVEPGDDALETFLALPEDEQRPLVIEVFFEELIASGVEATATGSQDYARGFAAIETLFPLSEEPDAAAGHLAATEARYAGDVSLLLSRISTVDGGDINLLVPGGLIDAGVASSASVQKAADELGIVAQRDGDVNIFARDDLTVNQSRVFTLDGGRIAIWSSVGDIDAGRGAKSALSIPGLTTTIDEDGNVVTEFPPAVQGSGIRAAVATPGREPGDVFLFAPQGIVNAGDAGIGSAGNITIGAVEVIGADNIDIGGISIGVPTADLGSVAAGLAGVSDASTAAAKSATEATGDGLGEDDELDRQTLGDSAVTFITVEVLSFGI